MVYEVNFSKTSVKQLEKLDQQTRRLIKNWIVKNLVNTENPTQQGKALTGKLKGIWRYRVGDYRLFAEIRNKELVILILEIAHRKEIYKKNNQ